MSSTRSGSTQHSPRLSSMPFAVVLMGLTVLLMLAGVLPVSGGGQDAVFRSPVFTFVLAILGASTFACVIRRRLSVRSIGFHLTHVCTILVMVGAFAGALFEKKFDIQLRTHAAPLRNVQLSDGEVVDLGFGLSLTRFRLEKYPPNVVVFHGHAPEEEHRLVEGAELDIANQKVTVERVVPHAKIENVELDGTPELVIGDPASPWKRILIDGSQPSDIELSDGNRLFISRVYNNLPRMEMGHHFRETTFPSRPGLILHVIASNSMAVLALPAGGRPQLLSPADPALGPDVPPLSYSFPETLGMDVVDSDDPAAPFVAELLLEGGKRHCLIEGGGRSGSLMLQDDCVLGLGFAADKHYEADLVVTRTNEEPTEKMLVINRPLDIDGWRLYLNSYDAKAHEHITITLRKDPGDRLVVAGILGLMIGTALIFFVRKRRLS
jgi:hypothetical protein